MGSRATMTLEGVKEVSTRMKENMPSSMLQRSAPCSLYYIAEGKKAKGGERRKEKGSKRTKRSALVAQKAA